MYSDYSTESELKLIGTITKMVENNILPNYIKKITFPFYKNLEKNSHISFDFPLTVIVGTNGTGKSSILRALQGAPKGRSLGNYWFSTSMDPIEESKEEGKRNSFFYEYIDERKETREVLKQRMQRAGDPDYWETSRPVLSYGMKQLENGKRNSAVDKEVVYLDFRTELSAFDKYFHLGLIDSEKTLKEKKSYIRIQSKKLRNTINNSKIVKIKSKNQNERVVDLTSSELECISFILGRKYMSGKIIKHKFFKDWGTSVILDKNRFSYTEAMAGSGEIAVVKIIHELFQAKEGALILLDEPEVSLHPGAQAKIKYVLLEMIKTKKIQVVISSHSTSFLDNLPKNAIKKLEIEPITEKILIKNECYIHEAFYTLGQKIMNSQYTIQTEDTLSAEIIKRLLEKMNPTLVSQFNICYNPGGASTIKTRFIPIFSQTDNVNTFIILDGDQKPTTDIIELELLTQRELTCDNLDRMIQSITNCRIEFITDGNAQNGGRKDQKLNLQQKYYNYFKNNVFFLPKLTPEDLIWDFDIISSLLNYNEEKLEKINQLQTTKKKLLLASNYIFHSETDIHSLERLLLTKWMEKESTEKQEIEAILNSIIEYTNDHCLV